MTRTLARCSAMAGSSNAFFASLLRLTDSAGLYDISLPVTARKASLAGLWPRSAVKAAAAAALTSGGMAMPLNWPPAASE